MKQLILDILKDVSKLQLNLESEAARKMIATKIMDGIKDKSWYLDLGTIDDKKTAKEYVKISGISDEEKAKWVCSICGKSTYEVDFDYIGSEYNHLGCELQIEMDNKAGVNPNDDSDYYTGPDSESV